MYHKSWNNMYFDSFGISGAPVRCLTFLYKQQ